MKAIRTVAIVLAAVLGFVVFVWLFALHPYTARADRLAPFNEHIIAHRGYFDNETVPENSMAAFQLAIDNGYGIELDVLLTQDKKVVVCHDADLTRLLGLEKNIKDCTYAELLNYSLLGTAEKIPLLSDVLELVDGRVPIVVEIKQDNGYSEITQALPAVLGSYEGVYCIESFNPLAVLWYKQNHPEVLRGVLSQDFFNTEEEVNLPLYQKVVLSNLMLNFLVQPDFISYNYQNSDQLSFVIYSRVFGGSTAGWTFTSQEEIDKSKHIFDSIVADVTYLN